MPGPTTQAYSSAPLRNIKKVQFGVLSPEELVSQVGFGKLKALGGKLVAHSYLPNLPFLAKKMNIFCSSQILGPVFMQVGVP